MLKKAKLKQLYLIYNLVLKGSPLYFTYVSDIGNEKYITREMDIRKKN